MKTCMLCVGQFSEAMCLHWINTNTDTSVPFAQFVCTREKDHAGPHVACSNTRTLKPGGHHIVAVESEHGEEYDIVLLSLLQGE